MRSVRDWNLPFERHPEGHLLQIRNLAEQQGQLRSDRLALIEQKDRLAQAGELDGPASLAVELCRVQAGLRSQPAHDQSVGLKGEQRDPVLWVGCGEPEQRLGEQEIQA